MRIVLLVTILIIPCQVKAWIGFGFQSGMSRFQVTRQLEDKDDFEVTGDDLHTIATSVDDLVIYQFAYCSTPQKMYLMKYRLNDSPSEFMKTLEKYEKRYGKPEGLEVIPDYRESDNWTDVVVSLIWDLSEQETILLTRSHSGVVTEFQDISVCR